MVSTRVLKSRIRSVKNTKQITRAMQMVAASKMRKAQEADKATAPYSHLANELLTFFSSQGIINDHPLFEKREINKKLLVVIAADKGLAGAYNSNILKLYLSAHNDQNEKNQHQTIAIGKKAAQFVTRIKDTNVIGIYEDLADHPAGNEIRAIVDNIVQKYINKEVDAVEIIYTRFNNSISQTPIKSRILPAGYTDTDISESIKLAKFEPDISTVLKGAVYRLLSAQIYQAILDAKASEWSMRMVAMKNATDNASDVIDDLTIEMNKARQGAITQELAEISSGVEALKL